MSVAPGAQGLLVYTLTGFDPQIVNAARLQDKPPLPHTLSWKLPAGNVVAGAAGAMRSAVDPGTLNQPALRVEETPTGTLLRLRLITGAGGEPGNNDNVTV